jgi:hypothetical protein
MQLGRVSIGIVAGIVALLAMFVVQALETRLFGSASGRSLMTMFLAAGIAVLWLADRFGILASAYTEPALGLRNSDADNSHDDLPAGRPADLRRRFDAILPPIQTVTLCYSGQLI